MRTVDLHEHPNMARKKTSDGGRIYSCASCLEAGEAARTKLAFPLSEQSDLLTRTFTLTKEHDCLLVIRMCRKWENMVRLMVLDVPSSQTMNCHELLGAKQTGSVCEAHGLLEQACGVQGQSYIFFGVEEKVINGGPTHTFLIFT